MLGESPRIGAHRFEKYRVRPGPFLQCLARYQMSAKKKRTIETDSATTIANN
jgi:hypothetical protein